MKVKAVLDFLEMIIVETGMSTDPEALARHICAEAVRLRDLIEARGGRDSVFVVPIEWDAVEWVTEVMQQYPASFAPSNPHYRKNHLSAPGTVRQWFRQMRAADWARDVEKVTSDWGGHFWFVGYGLNPWSIFDTLKVIDRETAAHYLKPDTGSIFFVQGGRIVGRIDNVLLEYPPHAGPLDGLTTVPLDAVFFRGRLPKPGEGRGITLKDVRRFVREDDARRSGRR